MMHSTLQLSLTCEPIASARVPCTLVHMPACRYAKGVAQGASAWTGPEWAPAKAKYDTEEEHH